MEHIIKSADGRTDRLHKITKPTAWKGGVQILKEEEDDAKPFARREEKRKEWAKHWQRDTKMQNLKDKLWRNEELNNFRGHGGVQIGGQTVEKRRVEKCGRRNDEVQRKRSCEGSKELQGKDWSWMRWLPSQRPVGFGKRNKMRCGGVPVEGGTV